MARMLRRLPRSDWRRGMQPPRASPPPPCRDARGLEPAAEHLLACRPLPGLSSSRHRLMEGSGQDERRRDPSGLSPQVCCLQANPDPKWSVAGGFLFKQWKEKFLVLSVDGSLLVCPDANSPAELGVSLGTGCGAILEGSEICDLPRLPLGAQRDSCLGLSLTDGKFLLFLAPSSQECRQWLNVLRKVKESFSQGSPSSCGRHIDSPVRRCCRKGGSIGGSPSTDRREAAWASVCQEGSSPRCLRHGRPAPTGVKAACLLVGGAAAGPTLGYRATSATAGNPEDSPPPDFKELGYHPSACDSESHYEALEYEGMDQDFDALDFGGFTF
ncbi:uncharacterized protein [Tiliqua scincoides]|uniref:uncharacterized protein n=1 Tax=Tiliqua scincoides TaxID=71010 RepID=UPI003462B0EE